MISTSCYGKCYRCCACEMPCSTKRILWSLILCTATHIRSNQGPCTWVTSTHSWRLLQGHHHTIHLGASIGCIPHHLGSCGVLNGTNLLVQVSGKTGKWDSGHGWQQRGMRGWLTAFLSTINRVRYHTNRCFDYVCVCMFKGIALQKIVLMSLLRS